MSVIDARSHLLSINEAARFLGVSRTSIYRLFNEGRLSFVHVTKGKRMVAQEDLAAFIANNRITSEHSTSIYSHEQVRGESHDEVQ